MCTHARRQSRSESAGRTGLRDPSRQSRCCALWQNLAHLRDRSHSREDQEKATITGNDEVREELVREELLQSKSFLSWTPGAKPPKQPTISLGRGRSFTYQGKTYKNLIVDEKHFSPSDLAKAWGVNVETIRNVFREEPGVVKIGAKLPSHKRSYLTLRIPQSVAVRVHKRLSE